MSQLLRVSSRLYASLSCAIVVAVFLFINHQLLWGSVSQSTDVRSRTRRRMLPSPLPQLRCTEDELLLADTPGWFRILYSADALRSEIGCPGPQAMAALHAADPSPHGKLFVNVGANKGYRLLSVLALWAPELLARGSQSLVQATLDYWTPLTDSPCGSCDECIALSPGGEAAPRGAGDPSAPAGSRLRLLAVEAAQRTFDALAASPLVAALGEGSGSSSAGAPLALMHALVRGPLPPGAGAAGQGPPSAAAFPHCPPGFESCGGAHDELPSVPTPATTVDALLASLPPPPPPPPAAAAARTPGGDAWPALRLPVPSPHAAPPPSALRPQQQQQEEEGEEEAVWLLVDAEGMDAAVVEGSRLSIAAGRVAVLEFEYHSAGAWRARSLGGLVELLDALGMTCFMPTRAAPGLRLLTGCWGPAEGGYEFHTWSTVLCASRRRPHLLRALFAISDVPRGAA